MPRAVIFVNGIIQNLAGVRKSLRLGDYFIAADGGTHHALSLGLIPSVIIGDLDSLDETERIKIEAGGSKLEQFSRDKDETDFELALEYAMRAGYTEVMVAGALGGRLDQMLGNLSLLSGERFAGMDICAEDGTEEAQFVRREHAIFGKKGDIVSLIPWGGRVTGVTTRGLRWALKNEDLYPDKTRGISNEMTASEALVTIDSGLLLIVHRHSGA